MKCMNCFKDFDDIIIAKIVDKKETKCLCPNCIAILEANETLFLENDKDFICEVSNKEGAIIYISGDEKYILDKNIMHRLLKHSLKRNEYKKLVKIHGCHKFMIHEDFYTRDGYAIQPMD